MMYFFLMILCNREKKKQERKFMNQLLCFTLFNLSIGILYQHAMPTVEGLFVKHKEKSIM